MNDAPIRTLTAQQACEMLTNKANEYVLLDVRTPGEFSSLHATGATNLPLHEISPRSLQTLQGRKILCICQKGGRGEQAAKTLCANGFTDIWNVEGGTDEWEKAGLPVIRGKTSISLERQVRIAAGALVVSGIVCAHLVSPYALVVSFFVGCGLIFSGVTNTCGMALILARCPWNSKPGA